MKIKKGSIGSLGYVEAKCMRENIHRRFVGMDEHTDNLSFHRLYYDDLVKAVKDYGATLDDVQDPQVGELACFCVGEEYVLRDTGLGVIGKEFVVVTKVKYPTISFAIRRGEFEEYETEASLNYATFTIQYEATGRYHTVNQGEEGEHENITSGATASTKAA